MRNYFFIIFILIGSALAEEKQTLQEYISEQIEQFESIERDSNQEDSWQLSKIRIRVKAKGGVEVPFLAKFEIKPYIELHYH